MFVNDQNEMHDELFVHDSVILTSCPLSESAWRVKASFTLLMPSEPRA